MAHPDTIAAALLLAPLYYEDVAPFAKPVLTVASYALLLLVPWALAKSKKDSCQWNENDAGGVQMIAILVFLICFILPLGSFLQAVCVYYFARGRYREKSLTKQAVQP